MSTVSEFTPHVGAAFRFGPMDLCLAKVEEHRHGSEGRDAFTLIFAGGRSPVLPEGIYETAVPGGQIMAIYIIPIHTAARDRQDYQAVFN